MMDFSLRNFRRELNNSRPRPQLRQPSPAAPLRSPIPFYFLEAEIAAAIFRSNRPVQQTVPQQPATQPNEASYVDVKTDDADSHYDAVDDFDAEAKMVQLVEVEDEHFQHSQEGPVEDDGDFTDTGTFLTVSFSQHARLPAFARRALVTQSVKKLKASPSPVASTASLPSTTYLTRSPSMLPHLSS